MSSQSGTNATELQSVTPIDAREFLHAKGGHDGFHSQPNSDGHALDGQEGDEAVIPLASTPDTPSNLRIALTVLQPSLVNFLASFTNGVITVGLPTIAQSLSLQRSLYLWPSSVYGLTSGSMLLIAGSIADLVGPRLVELIGILLLGAWTLACGFSTTGVQLVVFRALQGIALAMHLPSSVALVAAGVPHGRARNVGFACLGLSQPLGFSVGMVTSGIMIERVGWRLGFYLAGGATLLAGIAAVWMLPQVKPQHQAAGRIGLLKMLYNEIDWIGGALSSGGLAMLSYVLAILSADLSSIHSATTATLLSISLALLVAFPFWMHRRQRAGKAALIPNTLWRNIPFTTTCITVILSYGALNSLELFSSLYFQEVQKVSILVTSLYLLPSLLVGVLINLSVGFFVHRVPARWLVSISSFLCALSPLIMALVNPSWNYWLLEFWAQVFSPMSADVLFTVGLIIVSDKFPESTQALAGAVFSTVSQFGMGLGIGVCQVVALGVIGERDNKHVSETSHEESFQAFSKEDLLLGYRASFWTMFAYMMACGLIALIGLRQTGKVGVKRD